MWVTGHMFLAVSHAQILNLQLLNGTMISWVGCKNGYLASLNNYSVLLSPFTWQKHCPLDTVETQKYLYILTSIEC